MSPLAEWGEFFWKGAGRGEKFTSHRVGRLFLEGGWEGGEIHLSQSGENYFGRGLGGGRNSPLTEWGEFFWEGGEIHLSQCGENFFGRGLGGGRNFSASSPSLPFGDSVCVCARICVAVILFWHTS